MLARLAGLMIPASEKYGAPGADDEIILADIMATARAQAVLLKEGLQALDAYALEQHDVPFLALDQAGCLRVVERFQQQSKRFIRAVIIVTAQCYYRDARVMESLGMEARAPFPAGFELEEGDWSLLDPVRARGRIWRDADKQG